jgi:hypothetical protein
MDGSERDDIRKLLKEFGIKADGSVIEHLTRNDTVDSLDIRLTLEDLTDYGTSPPNIPLKLVVVGTIRR